jgi:hypothetical protein
MKRFLCTTALLFSLAALPLSSQAALLSYWNFNNVSTAYNSTGGVLGSFNTTAASYGEQYTVGTSTYRLSSNTANSTVFNSSSVYLDLTNLTTVTSAVVNGMSGTTRATTSSGTGGFGGFADTTTNRVSSDTTTGDSLIILNPSGAENGHYIQLSLSSAGYSGLTLTYDTRLQSSKTGTETWTYSTDGGTTWNSIATLSLTGTGSFSTQTVDLTSLTALNNQSTFLLRMAISGASASFAIDNLQLTASVPEPAACLSILSGIAMLGVLRRIRRRR